MIKTVLAVAALAAVSTGAMAQTAPMQDHAGHDMAASAPAAPALTIDSSIKYLLADPETAAILEKHLPGVAEHPARAQFEDMSLPEVAPMSGGAVTDEIIAAIDADLKALAAD